MIKRYCDKCIAEKVALGEVKSMFEFYGRDPLVGGDFKYNEKCDLCGEIDTVTAYPPMDAFIPDDLDLPEMKGTEEKVTIDKKEALLSKYRSVRSISTKKLVKLKEKCCELGISIHDALPNIWKDEPIDDKNAFPKAVEPMDKDEQIRKINKSFGDVLRGSVPKGKIVTNLALPMQIRGIDSGFDEITILKSIIVTYHEELHRDKQ